MHKSRFHGGVCWIVASTRHRRDACSIVSWRCRVHPTHGLIYAQVIAYAITEAGFWVGSVPFALGAAYVATGEIPDWTTEEGKTALGGYAFVLINFARLIVPARIALALAFAPWVDENIVKRINPPDRSDLPEDCVVEE